MFLKAADKKDKTTGKIYRYYKLCESYRIGDKIRHQTYLSLGKLEELQTNEQRKLLADRIEQLLKGGQTLFSSMLPAYIEKLARHYYEQIKRKGLESHPIQEAESDRRKQQEREYHQVDISGVTMEDAREIGCEWLCKQTIEELGIGTYLKDCGWDDSQIKTALLHIISKATYPASEHKTAQWIQDNSAVAELFDLDPAKISRFRLYRASSMLYKVKEGLEEYLSLRTSELFDLEDKIILSDLTNTYFEGRKDGSKLAKFYKSEEKRNDSKLVALALVVNVEGFIKYSKIFRGNIADCKTLSDIVDQLSARTSSTGRKPVIVIDVGIATDENLAMLKLKQYQYVCVSRSRLKDYEIVGEKVITLHDKREHPIEVRRVSKAGKDDRYLYVRSDRKTIKEASMNEHFSEHYEEELENIARAIHKKGGTKKYEKVVERIGRIKERYSTANKHYRITVQEKDGIAVKVTWKRKPLTTGSQDGIYFLRTNLEQTDEKMIWNIYNTIREVKATFRILKTDLSLRPVFHQKDEFTEAHLYLGIIAYMIVNTIRYRLKHHQIHHDWQNIVRIMNTQKEATITMNNQKDQQINRRICSIPSAGAQQIYTALGYKSMPFYQKKFVLPEL